MDATEAQQLLEEARQLVKQLSKLAVKHNAEELSATEPLEKMAKVVQAKPSETTQKNKTNTSKEEKPQGFTNNVLIGAGEAGIALVTPKEIHQYSTKQHTLTTSKDLNITTGQSWLASIGNKLSFFVQQGIKIFSGKGKIQIQAQNDDIEMIADKVIKAIANRKIELTAEEIILNGGTSYLRINSSGIYNGTKGEWKVHSSVKQLLGGDSIPIEPQQMPKVPTEESFVLFSNEVSIMV